MKLRAAAKLLICATFALAASCSALDDYKASQPPNVARMETRMEQAGFRKISIETPEQNGAVEQLPLHKLNRYDSAKGSVFWYADPTVCKCLYQGDLEAYQRYQGLVEQENDTADYMNDTQPQQVAYLSLFGDDFPRPTLFGPIGPVIVFLPPPAAVHPIGGGFGGGGFGGGIHGIGGSGGGGIHRR